MVSIIALSHFIKGILSIVCGELSKALLLISYLITMTEGDLEPYEELILSVKRKVEGRKTEKGLEALQ